MKNLSIILIAVAITFVSCKKESQQKTAAAVSPLAGKWSISKINAYMYESTGSLSNNITYKQPLADSNFVVFNTDGTCVWSTDHFYDYQENGQGVIHQNGFRVSNLAYKMLGNYIDLNFTGTMGPTGPSAVSETENGTLQAPDTLVIHSTYTITNGIRVMADSYYTRK